MIINRKKLLLSLTMMAAATIFAEAQQQGTITNGFNLDNYPEVSFIYHSFNPDTLSKDDFWYLKESGTNIDFSVKLCHDSIIKTPQTTIFLWEDLAHNGQGQFDFTRRVLSEFFSGSTIQPSDKLAVYAFNRRKNTPSTLYNLTDGFVNDRQLIIDTLNKYRQSTEHFSDYPNRTDLYSAIRESLDTLAQVKGSKSIIVFTAGYSMKSSGADSESQVLLKAQRLHIPVYIFQYYLKSGIAPEAEGFAKSTFGSFASYKDAPTAAKALTALYPELAKRYHGLNYKITFHSDAKKGEAARTISMQVRGEEIQEQLLPPPHSLSSYIKAHPGWIIALIILLSIIVIAILSFANKAKKNEEANRRELEALEQRRLQDKQTAEQYQREAANQLSSEKAQRLREQQQVEEDRLRHLMELKNLFPSLKYRKASEMTTFEINKPTVTIGRDPGNDIVLTDSKVSRHHAKIVFNGYAFEIIDTQSTNKVIVNGMFIERKELKSGDIIGLGEDILTFYL